MASERRRGAQSSATRAELIEAATVLIREDGYAALTSRTLADKLNLSRQIVHYYFKSIDELCIALVQESGSRTLRRLETAVQSAEPLRAVWELCHDPEQAALSLELNALAHRRPAVRAEVKKFAEQFRRIQTQALIDDLKRRGIEPSIKPIVATVLLSGLSQVMALEDAIDIKLGHADTFELVDACLQAFAAGVRPHLPLGTAPFGRPARARAKSGTARATRIARGRRA
jgi:TetR/AcrR family transcriptional regulator